MKGVIARWAVLMALGVVDFELHRPWRLIVLPVIAVYLWQWIAFRHRREAIRIVRQRRHRLANRLQIIDGWLQLGSTTKAEEALSVLMQQQAAESGWFRGMPSFWSYLFLRWDGQAEERGLAVHWENLEHLAPTYRTAWMLEWRLSQAMRMAETALRVQFFGRGFRVEVADAVSQKLPAGWRLAVHGIETEWYVGKGADPPDSPVQKM